VSGSSIERAWRTGGARWAASLTLVGERLEGHLEGPEGLVEVAADVKRTGPDAVLLRVNGRVHRAVLARQGSVVWVAMDGQVHELVPERDRQGPAGGDEPLAASPMTGVLVKVHVAAGDRVEAGAELFVVEAMKMEYAVRAPRDVTVAAVSAAAGDRVAQGQPVVLYAETR
jgi:3-methylcrotonyl-CoA carboxylase alpha subunit